MDDRGPFFWLFLKSIQMTTFCYIGTTNENIGAGHISSNKHTFLDKTISVLIVMLWELWNEFDHRNVYFWNTF